MSLNPLRRRSMDDDHGLAMLTVLMVIGVLGALTITATALTVNNVKNSSRDRQSLGALSSSEAGVASAVQYLRGTSLSQLSCTEPAAGATPGSTCTTSSNPWVNANSPQQVRIDGGTGSCVTSSDCFKVWIGTITPYRPSCPSRYATPPTPCYGLYRIHSTGLAGNGPGARRVAVDVKLRPLDYPLGVFAEQGFSGNGNVGLHNESVFTAGCISNRQNDAANGSGFQFTYDSAAGRTTLDKFYDIPTAAHAVGNVSTSNTSCDAGSGGAPVHSTAACNPTFKYDQDGSTNAGALTAGDGCFQAYTHSDGVTKYPTTSKFTLSDLQNLYGYRPRGLTDAQYDQLRTTAQSQGTYNVSTTSISSVLTSLLAAGITSPVLYWDNGDVSLSSGNFPASFLRNPDESIGCTSSSVTIVVAGGSNSLTYQGGNTAPYLSAAIFVPDGTLRGNGGRNTIGTVFAKSIDLGGNLDFYMDNCFAANPPGATVEVQVTNFREDDGTDVN